MKKWSDRFFHYPIAEQAYSDFCHNGISEPHEIIEIAAKQFLSEYHECHWLSYELARDFLERV